MFQFPSSGKVYSKKYHSRYSEWQLSVFQFPSSGKVYSKILETRLVGLESKETWFQFPSSGKVYSKTGCGDEDIDGQKSFNSLRAGKSIQRHLLFPEPVVVDGKMCFNSLRAGKSIQRGCGEGIETPVSVFQFPSSGKVYSKILETRLVGLESKETWFQFPSSGKVYSKWS